MSRPRCHYLLRCLTAAVFLVGARGEVVINEIMAAASDRLLQFDANGVPQVGTGPRWYQAAYSDAGWLTGPGPFGFAQTAATNLQNAVRYLTPTTYFRKTFSTTASGADPVQLVIEYNDGFVAFLNGVEVARRNGGPAKKWIYHDQPAFNRESFSGTATIPTGNLIETINLGTATDRLVAGENVLAIHLLNATAANTTYFLKADLRVGGAVPVPLVNFNDPWKYFPGVVEPSGNLFDPALLESGKQHVLWGTLGFDAGAWSSGLGPFGFGGAGAVGTNTQTAMQNITPSLYTRAVFEVTAAQAADGALLKLVITYDDGFVAYLNGVEVARRRIGLPNTFTPHDAVADSEVGAAITETITLEAASKRLVAGTNVLAIQGHNVTPGNADFYLKADLQTGASVPLVTNNAAWQFLIGTAEPLPPPPTGEEDSFPDGPDSAADWIELHNNGAAPVSLNGWSLSDDAADRRKWVFPDVSIPAGGYLVVIADGRDLAPAGGFLHANFALDRDGDYAGLADANGVVVSEVAPSFPPQSPFHSFVRDAGGAFRFSDLPTPGAANGGTLFAGRVEAPTVDLPGRFYNPAPTVAFTCATPGAVQRYTLDGKEPTAASLIMPASLTVTSSRAVRVRAFLDGWLPSEIVTHTYLVNQSAGRRSLPAVCLTGDEQQVFYRPFGVFAIVNNAGNNYAGGIWSNHPNATTLNPPNTPEDPLLYNMPMQSGRPSERALAIELLHTDATPDLRIGAWLRAAASPYSRPRYRLSSHNSPTNPNATSPWPISDVEKPQLNVFFRDDVGSRPLKYPFIRGSFVKQYDDIRLRAGKNELFNPFVRDEFTRRTMIEMGHVTVLGDFANLYVNGSFKGYYNTTERPREPFFQQARGTDAGFDVRNIDTMADGDTLALNEVINYARTANLTTQAGYDGLAQRLDVVNFADYILLNTYAGTWDWPQNNYVMDRARSATGIYRFSVWDAEGAFGLTGRDPNSWNQFTGGSLSDPLISQNVAGETRMPILFYTVLRQNAEWRLLFADRLRKHLFNNGTLTATRMSARFAALKAVMEPMFKDSNPNAVMTDFVTPWKDPRRNAYLPQCRAQGLWPDTLGPDFSQFGGNVPAGFQLALTNPNASGTIYYTTNGDDPRAVGGAPVGTLYNGAPIPISQTALVRARVRITDTNWSPLTEAIFATANPAPLIVSEIMYHPRDEGAVSGEEFEFVEVKNVGATAVSLAGIRFANGIGFEFPRNASLAPGSFAVLARNPAQFAARYPGVPVLGSYGTASSLNNGGETLTLVDVSEATVFTVSYDNTGAWPASTDGAGKSLVPRNRNGFTDASDPAQWRASIAEGGSPGTDDDQTFAQWKSAHFTPEQLNDPVVSGPDADIDADGMSTFEEFALGLDPLRADGAGASATELLPDGAGGRYLTLRYRRNLGAAGVEYHVDTAAMPGAWILDASLPAGPPVDNGDGTITETRRDIETTSSAAQRFIRLRLVGE